MKQTNSAIKFLMAQYRAIFNNAYFKGLASAAIVTMAMAAGQAQAAADANLEQTDTLPKDKTELVIDGQTHADSDTTGVYQNIHFSGASAKELESVSIKITGGAASTDGTAGNFIAGAGTGTTFTAKNLTIETI